MHGYPGRDTADGALPAVKIFKVNFRNINTTPSFLPKLARALTGGALPLLQELDVEPKTPDDLEVNILADMLENCARIPGCHGLENFHVGFWPHQASHETQIDSCVRCCRH